MNMIPNDAHEHGESCGCGCSFDLAALKQRITELEGKTDRTPADGEQLAHLYWSLAKFHFDEGDELSEIFDNFDKAEAVLKQTVSLPGLEDDDPEMKRNLQRGLGNLYLDKADVYNNVNEIEQAIEAYGKAIETLKPMEDAGDGEAKYDIAGIRLNRGDVYYEVGEFEKAKADYEESFTAFRAVEKISDLDTRYYMGKVSIAQGNLLRAMGEPLDKIVDAYNRAMRLFVELIDVGQMEHERDLANALMDRCTATYEDFMDAEFATDTERQGKFADVLVDVGRGVEILERLAQSGELENRIDLLNALLIQGSMLLDLDRCEESVKIFDRTIKEFADFADETDPVLLNQYAGVLENRGHAKVGLGEAEASLVDFTKSIELREKIQSPDFDLDDDERMFFRPSLANNYANRSVAYLALENKDAAKKDCQKGIDLLRSIGDDDDEEIAQVLELFESLREQCC